MILWGSGVASDKARSYNELEGKEETTENTVKQRKKTTDVIALNSNK